MNEEKRARDRALLGRMHPGLFGDVEDVSRSVTSVNFDGGVRTPSLPVTSVSPSLPTPVHREPGGWVSAEIDAEAIFPWLR